MTSLIMVICTVLLEKLDTILGQKEPGRQDITNFSFKIFKIMRSLRSSKCLKTTVKLTFSTQKANTCSPRTTCSFFNWKYFFWGKFGPKTQNYQLKLKFCT